MDFHTSEHIDGIGKKFDKSEFQEALIRGHVNSVTVFSKCHHGWTYHPTKASEMHPNLDFDLMGAQIDAAHEIGVKAVAYISGGFDEKMARRHPDWLVRNKDETMLWSPTFANSGYHKFCMNSPYLEYLLSQVREVCENYDADGIFIDIVNVQPCYCQNCINILMSEDKEPYEDDNIIDLAERTFANYAKRVRETIDEIKPGLPVFHNGGHIRGGRRDLAYVNSHLELESLPTGGYGYDHFPLTASFARILGMDFLGMTGKFHKTWGEFGGYKHKNALIYETAFNAAFGAKSSIGDQLHPSGKPDRLTYDLIGAAYKEIESKEPWLDNVTPVVDIGLLSNDAMNTKTSLVRGLNLPKSDIGAVRMLLEGKYLFNVIDLEEDFLKYKVIILPDIIKPNTLLSEKLSEFIKNGGKVLATGESAIDENGEFVADLGAVHKGRHPYRPTYFRPDTSYTQDAAYLVRGDAEQTECKGHELAHLEEPYFNRTAHKFCSHMHTPNSEKYGGSAITEGSDGIYIAWKIFDNYARYGSLISKTTVHFALDRLLGNTKTICTSLPSKGTATLMQQKSQNRFVAHALYASPVKRGEDTEVIEDIIPLYNIDMIVRTDKEINKVYLAPQMQDIPFECRDGEISFTIPCIDCHQMIVMDY